MARLQSKTLFFITSPRTPMKMQAEIELLVDTFSGKPWNATTQEAFIQKLAQATTFEGNGSLSDMAFSARDRINRGPKALGFVDIKPTIALTEAGKNFLDEEAAEEALLRQLLKFQLPSPYHIENQTLSDTFEVKPYLEIFRLIYVLEKVTFDEIMIFGMQLTSYTKFEEIVEKIRAFRLAFQKDNRNYKVFMGEYRDKEIEKIYQSELEQGKTKTRESKDISRDKFIKTKASNMRDYTDACFRYLRATGLISISQRGKSLSIMPEKLEEVKYFLNNIDRKPCFVYDEKAYKEYLFNGEIPTLYTDNRVNPEQEADKFGITPVSSLSTPALKKFLKRAVIARQQTLITEQIKDMKAYKTYQNIMDTFRDIQNKNFYDVPLMLEWNTWRAMTMLDGGNVHANLKFDDNGQPMSTASGNMPDIVCDYGNFFLAVEVTMQSGQRQYEMEGESVPRHLAKIKKEQGKKSYCFFIAPTINESCIAHFFTLHRTNIDFYGGKSVILPLELSVFEKMVEQTGKAGYEPKPEQIKRLCEFSLKTAQSAGSEKEWYTLLKEKASAWLTE